MILYFAGFGHALEKDPKMEKYMIKKQVSFLVSFSIIKVFAERVEWIDRVNKQQGKTDGTQKKRIARNA